MVSKSATIILKVVALYCDVQVNVLSVMEYFELGLKNDLRSSLWIHRALGSFGGLLILAIAWRLVGNYQMDDLGLGFYSKGAHLLVLLTLACRLFEFALHCILIVYQNSTANRPSQHIEIIDLALNQNLRSFGSLSIPAPDIYTYKLMLCVWKVLMSEGKIKNTSTLAHQLKDAHVHFVAMKSDLSVQQLKQWDYLKSEASCNQIPLRFFGLQ